jgi:Sap, sulfolipid-1-addressing protein
MAEIVLLALGSAFFPTLLACVAIILSRPEPRRLLMAFYAGALIASIGSGLLILAAFSDGHSVLGNTTTSSHPSVALGVGAVALLFSWLLATKRGQAAVDGWRDRHPRRRRRDPGKPSWAERRLDNASARVAFVVGAIIDLPGPFYILALGKIATGGYPALAQIALILLFNAIMFLLLEVPLVGYLLRPEPTRARVQQLAHWLNANGMRVVGWMVGFFGLALIAQGAYSLAT